METIFTLEQQLAQKSIRGEKFLFLITSFLCFVKFLQLIWNEFLAEILIFQNKLSLPRAYHV